MKLKSFVAVASLFFPLFFSHSALAFVEVTPCQQVNMAILAKDNLPYWADAQSKPENVESCYNVATEVLISGSTMEISYFQNAVSENVKIFVRDYEFQEYIEAHEDSSERYNVLTAAPKISSLLPVQVPITPLY